MNQHEIDLFVKTWYRLLYSTNSLRSLDEEFKEIREDEYLALEKIIEDESYLVYKYLNILSGCIDIFDIVIVGTLQILMLSLLAGIFSGPGNYFIETFGWFRYVLAGASIIFIVSHIPCLYKYVQYATKIFHIKRRYTYFCSMVHGRAK